MSTGIRAAAPGDEAGLVELYEWLFASPGSRPAAWDPERAGAALAEAIASEHSTVLVAREEGETVGFCTAYLDLNSVRFGLRCWVEDLAVHPQHRTRGIGARLLAAARVWARERGATHLELDSAESRTDAHHFYEREQPSWQSRCYSWEL